jgi:hypothetical protein
VEGPAPGGKGVLALTISHVRLLTNANTELLTSS